LCETRRNKNKVRSLRSRLGLRGFAGVDSEGLSGGLALFWHESMSVEIKDMNKNFIDAYVRLSPNEPLWRITCIYGAPRVENRAKVWSQLQDLRGQSNLPWLVVGDFNEALWQFEHMSATPRNENQMMAFRDTLQICGLVDLGFVGVPFTYDNKRQGNRNVKVRLDRAVADSNWRNMFADYGVKHIVSPCSDHVILLVSLKQEQMLPRRKTNKQYEILWERAGELEEIIDQGWNNEEDHQHDQQDLADIMNKLNRMMSTLQGWSKRKFGNVLQELNKYRRKLEQLLVQGGDSEEIRNTSDHIDELLYREEMLWLQRSRVAWLKEGDRNTRFFHQKAIWRARKNKVKKLKDSQGEWQEEPAVMERMTNSFFKELFTRDLSLNANDVSQLIENKVTEQMNNALTRDFNDEEISNALFQIGPLKAPGPDGFPARFFQRNWGTIKGQVIGAVKKFFQTGKMPNGVNEATIVLIPKVDHPAELKEFRPISLCTVIYKVVAKCLVNRLRLNLGELVSPNQSAFVPGRLITDNALIAFECLHFIEHNKKEDSNYCAYKLDLSKAYDRVD
jgi:hypothetical protein